MAQAQVVYTGLTGLTDGSVAMGTLFKGMKFWIAQRCPMRSSFVDQVKSNGGDVVQLEKHADILIVDHARKDIAPGTHSYTFIEQSIRKGELEDLDNHIAGPPAGSIRPVGSVRPTKGGRVPFTAEDDRVLREWVRGYQRKGGKVLGNEIYKQLEAVNNRHTWQSWRDRYVKYLSQGAPPSEVPDNGPPTPPLDMPAKPARLLRKSPPAPTKAREDLKLKHLVDGAGDDFEQSEAEGGNAEPLKEAIMRKVIAAGIRSKNPWIQADFDDLFRGAPNIEATPVQEYRQGWVQWAEAWETHTIEEWREFYEKVVYPLYRRSLREKHGSQSRHEEDREPSLPSGKEDSGSHCTTNSTGCMRKSMVGAEAKNYVSPDEITSSKANPNTLENTDATLRRNLIVLIPTSSDRTANARPSQHGGRSPTSALLDSASPTQKRARMNESVQALIEESPSPQPRKRRRTDYSHVDSPSLSADELEAMTVPGQTAVIGGRPSGVESLAHKVTFDDDVRHDSTEEEDAEHELARTRSPTASMGRLGKAASQKNSNLRFREPSPMVEGVEMLDEIVGDLEEEAAASDVQKLGLSSTSSIRDHFLDIINLCDAGMPEEASARREAYFRMCEADDDWHQLSSSVEDFQSAPEKVREALSSSAQQLQDELEQPLSHYRQPTVESVSSREDEISSATQYVGLTESSPSKPIERSESPPSRHSLGGSSSVRRPQPPSPPAAAATNLETQAPFGLETQYIDFDVPEPDGGFGEMEDEDVLGIKEGEGEELVEHGEEEILVGQEESEDQPDEALYLRGEEGGQQGMLEEEWEGMQHEARQEPEEGDVVGIGVGARDEVAENEKEEIYVGQEEILDEQDEAVYSRVEGGGQQEMLEQQWKGMQHEARQKYVEAESGEEEDSTQYNPSVASRDRPHYASKSPEAATSTRNPDSTTEEDWIYLQYSRGYTEEEVAQALLSTSLRLELAGEVLAAMRGGGCIPRGLMGVWTDRDDEVLEEADSGKVRTSMGELMLRGRMRRLEEKHGKEEIKRRRAYWENRKAAALCLL